MSFMDNLQNTLNEDSNVSVTENGAVGFKTTGTKLLDLNFAISSLRSQTEKQIVDKFVDAFYEDKLLAVKWLFYVSDVREGVGERRLFRVCMRYLIKNHPQIAKVVIPLIPEYNRWDNMAVLLTANDKLSDDIVAIIKEQLTADAENMNAHKPISLCAKWMPSVNASNKDTRYLGRLLAKKLSLSEKEYRKLLSALRAYLGSAVVEVLMSSKKWDKVDYPTVCSRANLNYNPAFLRNDEVRRRAYLEKLEKGETKINAGVLFPHDIVHKYTQGYSIKSKDIAIEEMWKALPDYVKGNGNTIVVADGSGSMTSTIGKTKVSCLEVADALAIYFAERSSGQFKNKYITFSENPQLVNLGDGSLRDKIGIALRYNECANTNIEAVFNLVLKTAINNKMKQEELPANILVLSDMEFDSCVTTNNRSSRYYSYSAVKPTKKLFDEITALYKVHGYKLPRLVFWNINSRTGTIPVRQNDLGVALVSGFSPAVVKMVLSNSTDPFQCLLEQINCERYQPVENAIKNLI